MTESFGIIGILSLAWAIFTIYFIFKILQFVLVTTNLNKKMINQQNAIIKLLIDIRDNKKSYDDHITSFEDEKEEDIIPPALLENQKICDKCGTVVPLIYKRCSKCGNKFE